MVQLRNEDIYEAALDDDGLSRLPEMLAQATHARSCVISWFHADGAAHDVLNYSYFPQTMIQQYIDAFLPHDIWTTAALSKPLMNQILFGDIAASEQEFERSILFNEFFRANGDDTFFCMGGAQVTKWGTALIGVHRDRRKASFEEGDRLRLTGIARHVRGALTLRGRLATERRAAEGSRAAWDAVNLASVIVSRNGRVVQHNAMADAVFRCGCALKVARNVLSAAGDDNRARLAKAIRLATAPAEPTGSSLMLGGPDGETYLLSVVPISRGAGPSLALVTFKDPLAPADTLKGQLRSIWKLTAQEASVAAELAQGRSIAEIAERKGVLGSTIKTQLKAISGKMGARGQAELIAKMRMLS